MLLTTLVFRPFNWEQKKMKDDGESGQTFNGKQNQTVVNDRLMG